ncbi:questin oxidase family protein [Streptomyces sp. DSM 44915]|uniref:Questin oxidase family protein n=1 Tax=Streptomyces chisholmiae TaxID=3075540 RepID=A0ABU2JM54_9ACTN|nr:questin oxidase family protein [Streptomyces sp. DSM 44915]MDT0266065.1 questin oxidase family protein [Streptomyces sp. DSM 44915]
MDATHGTSPDGTLDEALLRLHRSGPEFQGWLSNHGPMAVEALVRHGQAERVHRWLDRYQGRLVERPTPRSRITAENWRERLGDARHLADWSRYFTERLAERPWRAVLAEWWPRLLPGIAAGATHPVIRVGHAVRVLLTDGESAPRLAELAEGLGYWAARHQPLPAGIEPVAAEPAPAAALRAVAPVPDRSLGINHRLGQLTTLPDWGATLPPEPAAVRARLAGLVRAAAGHYVAHAPAGPVMLVHAVTAPNAVLRTLPALPERLWRPSAAAAWAASAAVVAAYAPGGAGAAPADDEPAAPAPDEVFARAAEHGDEHAIKLADTVADLLAASPDDPLPGRAVLRAVTLIEPD